MSARRRAGRVVVSRVVEGAGEFEAQARRWERASRRIAARYLLYLHYQAGCGRTGFVLGQSEGRTFRATIGQLRAEIERRGLEPAERGRVRNKGRLWLQSDAPGTDTPYGGGAQLFERWYDNSWQDHL